MPGSDTLGALVARLRAAPPPVAVLAGSGTSAASGVSTGEDLLLKIARDRGEDAAADPVGWYLRTFGVFPNYFGMLQQEAGRGADPRALPRAHFESGPAGPIEPSPAHRALAAMAAARLIGPVLTPNFDRLLERALQEAGVRVAVAFDLAAMARAAAARWPSTDDELLLVKLHGDVADISIRDTSRGFATYHSVIDALLDRVLSRCDLLVCGWSASWDIPLRRAMERCAAPDRRLTFWMLRGSATPDAAHLIAVRDARVIPVPSSSAGLAEVQRLLALPASTRGGA